MSDSTGAASRKVAFLGLGVMGYHMAGHLAKAGHDVTVYNRTGSKAARWTEEFGGRRATTPAEAAAGNGIVFACVGNDDDVRSVTVGADGAFEGMDSRRCVRRPHHRLRRRCQGARRRRRGAWPRVHGRAGVRRRGGRRERSAHGDGRGRAGRVRAMPARHRRLRARRHPPRTGRLRPAHQDGQPDLHRRGSCRGSPRR